MKTNFTAELSAADLAKIKTALTTIRQLLPFLLTLSKRDRRKLFKMGDKSLAFVQNSLQAARNNPDILPGSFDAEKMEKDVDIVVILTELNQLIAQLHSDTDDTLMAFGSQAINQGTDVYTYAKAAAKTQPGLKTVVEQLGTRFVKKARKKSLDKAA